MKTSNSYYEDISNLEFAITILKNMAKKSMKSDEHKALDIAITLIADKQLKIEKEITGYGYKKIGSDIDNLYDQLGYQLRAYEKLNEFILKVSKIIFGIIAMLLSIITIYFLI